MAHVYVRSAAAGTGTGASWANAYTTLAAALTAKAAGDNFWVSEDHAETQAAFVTLASPGTPASPCTVMCVNHSGSVPPVSADLRTTATISATGFGNPIYLDGYVSNCYGIHFSVGGGGDNNGYIALYDGNANTKVHWVMVSCLLEIASTRSNSNAAIYLGGNGGGHHELHWTWINTTVKFGAANQCIAPRGRCQFEWLSTASAIDAGGSTPNTLFVSDTEIGGAVQAKIIGVDLSALGSGKTLVSASGQVSQYDFLDCKLGASVTVSGTPAEHAAYTRLVNCDSGATNYRAEQYLYAGTQTVETTIVRTGGASDNTTSTSVKIVTTPNANWLFPYVSMPMPIWIDTTGANVTVTVYGIWGGGAVPNNDDIWIEVWYMGSSSTPIATINTANTKADYLATGSAQTSDASVWGGSTTAFKMAVTLSSPQPNMKGPGYVIVKAAAASATFYVDEKPVLT